MMAQKLALTHVVLVMGLLLAWPAAADTLTAEQLLEKNYLANRLSDASATISMTLRNEAGTERLRKLTVYSKLQAQSTDAMYALVFSSPADIKDTATLLIQRANSEDDMWAYLPALRKSRRLLTDNKRDSFMGSEVSYGDIIGHRPSDWKATILRDDVVDGVPVVVIEATPISDAIKGSSGYSKRVLTLDKNSFLAVKAEFWDDEGIPLKVVTASDIKPLANTDGQFQFFRLEADHLQTHNHTTLIYDSFEYNQGLQDALFTQRAMETGFE